MARKHIFVRIGNGATPVGELIVSSDGQRETSVFRYDDSWIDNPRGFALSPGMRLERAPFYFNKDDGSSLPPAISDGTPDSWGRAIIKAYLGGRPCNDSDFLLQSSDLLRSGALRFYDSRDTDAVPLAAHVDRPGYYSVPRLIDLDALVVEARAFEADPARYRETRAHLIGGELLKGAVGSLGGARPKINAVAEDGSLWIVKMAKMDDQHSVAHAEVLALALARRVGIDAAEARILPSSQKYPIAVVRRFDRGAGGRLPFISAQTFMGLPGAQPGNYADIAFQMREWSSNAQEGRLELFRRLAYNILIQNTDDHLRNLGFLYDGANKWKLSPAYDVNPVPEKGTTLKTAISEIHGYALDVDQLLDAATYFEIDDIDEAAAMVRDMAATIRDSWRHLAGQLQMSGQDIRFLAPAFENPQIKRAASLGATLSVASTTASTQNTP